MTPRSAGGWRLLRLILRVKCWSCVPVGISGRSPRVISCGDRVARWSPCNVVVQWKHILCHLRCHISGSSLAGVSVGVRLSLCSSKHVFIKKLRANMSTNARHCQTTGNPPRRTTKNWARRTLVRCLKTRGTHVTEAGSRQMFKDVAA